MELIHDSTNYGRQQTEPVATKNKPQHPHTGKITETAALGTCAVPPMALANSRQDLLDESHPSPRTHIPAMPQNASGGNNLDKTSLFLKCQIDLTGSE